MPNPFLAASDLTIHTYGGGLILQKVFTAISMLSSENGIIGPMMFVCAALGFGFIFCKLIATQGFENFLSHYLFPFFAIYTAFIIPTTTVHIEDELSRPLIYKVDHVPRLLAHFAEIASSIGFYATTCIEKAMHTVNDTKYTQTGLIFGADTALDFRRFQLTNPNLQKDLREFSKQCVLYDLALGRYSLDDLKKSTDLWDFLKKRTSKLGMIYYCPPGSKQCQYLSCQKAIEEFEPLFDKEKAYYAKQEIGKNLPLTFQALTKIKQDSEKLISQQLMMNILSDQFSGEKFAEQRAYIQQNTTYQTTGFLASKGVVVMRCVFEAIIYIAFLFILPLAILPGGIKLLINWAWLVIWIQFWPPFYAILNYIASIITEATTAGIQEGVVNKGLSIFTSIGLQNFSSDTAALAGYLTLSVPYLSYIILQGGVHQFVQLASTLTSPTQGAASSAAHEQTSGNYSYDNISVGQHSANNTTAFQTNVAPSVSAGYFTENKGYERTDYTTQGAIYTQNVSNPTSSINADQVFGESLQHQKQYAESNVETTSKNYQESLSYATNSASNLANHIAHSDNYSKNISDREAYDTQQAVRRMESAADNWGKQYGLSNKESMDIAFAGSVGGEAGISKALNSLVGVGVSLSGKGSLSYSSGADTSKMISSALNFAQSTEFQENYQKVKDYAISQASSSSTDEGVRFAQDFSQSLNGVQTNQEALNAAKTELNQISDTSSWYQQNAHMIKENLNQKYMDWAVDKYNEKYGDGAGLDRLKEVMNSSSPSASLETQSLIYEFVQSEMDQQTSIKAPSSYQDPQTAYGNSNFSEVDSRKSLDSISASYSIGKDLVDQVYGKNLEKQEEHQKNLSAAAEKQDSYAYFTRNNNKYGRDYAINRFNIEKQRTHYMRAKDSLPLVGHSREETSSDYQISEAPFWSKGEQ